MNLPESIQPAPAGSWAASRLAMGFAVCPKCFLVHADCGRQHLTKPWRIAPRCIECGTQLRMPARPRYEEMA